MEDHIMYKCIFTVIFWGVWFGDFLKDNMAEL